MTSNLDTRQGIYYHLNHNSQWYIYDCFYSDSGELVIICAAEIKPVPKIWLLPDSTNPENKIEFMCDICTANHTYVYRLSAHALETMLGKVQQLANINIQIQTNYTNQEQPREEEKLTICPNRYPSYAGKVVMTTMVKNEDNIIRTWVDFHIRLGISQFVIYDNAGTSESLASLQAELSDYILDGQVILISWPYDYRLPKSGISGQTTQQNHAIRAFDTADWIGLFDVDEYINIQRPDVVLNVAPGISGITRFLNGVTRRNTLGKSKIGGVQFANKFFYNPDNLPVNNGQFLNIPNCAQHISINERQKCFVIPYNVKIFDIHNIKVGGPLYLIPHKLGYFNHYIYLNKKDRGQDITPWIDTTINRYLTN